MVLLIESKDAWNWLVDILDDDILYNDNNNNNNNNNNKVVNGISEVLIDILVNASCVSDINIGGSNELKYQALAYPINGGNGTDAGCAGNIRQSSYLIFHSGTVGTENGNGKRTATKHVRAMLIEEE